MPSIMISMRLWEELETGLRHQGRITSNYLLLMAVGGIIAAAGVLAEPAVATVAYVASSIGSIVSRIQLLLADLRLSHPTTDLVY